MPLPPRRMRAMPRRPALGKPSTHMWGLVIRTHSTYGAGQRHLKIESSRIAAAPL